MRATSGPILPLVMQIAVPAGLGMLFQTLFNVVDSYFAGWISTEALTALGASFPVYFVLIALLVGLGQATTALMSNALGEGDEPMARRIFVQAVLATLAMGILLALFGLVAVEPLLRLLGVRGESVALGRAYLVPIMLTSALFVANATVNAFLTCQGDARSYRNALLFGVLLNVALDPLFIFGAGPLPGLGVLGIALSTILIQALQLLYLLHRLRHSPLGRACGWFALRFEPRVMAALLRQAVPTTATMAITGIGLFAITFFMGRHGEAAVAAYGVALRIEQLVMLPMIGLTTAALTLVGQNHGARLPDRVRQVTRTVMLLALAIMSLGALLVWPLRETLMGLFSDDAEVIRLGAAYLAVAVLIFDAYALLAVGFAVLQGLKRPVFAMYVGLFRHVLGPLMVLSLLDPVLGFGLAGIYWGIAGVAWLGGLATLLYLMRRLRALNA
ncbi:MAG: MATE family efflux transporter [Geminicoccaceae bacterium]|nr:MATE family efflux transporter [Geminicoccaceae bacterium]